MSVESTAADWLPASAEAGAPEPDPTGSPSPPAAPPSEGPVLVGPVPVEVPPPSATHPLADIAPPAPTSVEARSAEGSALSGPHRTMRALGVTAVVLGLVQIPLAAISPRLATISTTNDHVEPATRSSAPTASTSAMIIGGAAPPSVPPIVSASPSTEPAPPPNGPRRVFDLASADVEILRARVGRRTCGAALSEVGLAPTDVARVVGTLAHLRPAVHCAPTDWLFVARQRRDKALVGAEFEHALGQIVQLTPSASTTTDAGPSATGGSRADFFVDHLSLPVTHRRVLTGFAVHTDVAAALSALGYDPSLATLLDEALIPRHDLPKPGPGARLRLIADATYVGGYFDRWDDLAAFEYVPRKGQPPLRLYQLRRGDHSGGAADRAASYYDQKAQQPVRGHFRMPVPSGRVTSRFNPNRLHPVLHVRMPHNGCDFKAPLGTPVYSIAPGVVIARGESGPSGNLVVVRHDGGLESGYAHLSRYAPGLTVGTHVDAKTLLGYSGSTGRSTGPHLHLSVKRNGVFIDPLSLKLDSFRSVPRAERDAFTQQQAEINALLDSIAIVEDPDNAPADGRSPPETSSAAAPSSAPSGTSPSTAPSTADHDDDEDGPDQDLDDHPH